MFAGLVTKGLVITKLNPQQKEELKTIHETKDFVAGGRTLKNWAHLSLDARNLEKVLPFVKKSYESARNS